MKKLHYPLNIQLFADGDGAQGGGQPAGQVITPPASSTTPPEINYDKLAEVVSKRATGTEEKVLQGYFKDQGLNPEQAKEAINQYKQAQIAKQQQEAQALQQMQSENAQLKAQILNAQIDTKVAELSSSLGVQPEKVPFLNKLVDRSKAAKEDGTLNDENIKTAIEEVLKAFPDFKSTSQSGGFQQIGSGTNNQGAGGNAIEDALDNVFGVKKK